jgi:hypothetical protein
MPSDETRRLLKLFGVAVTDFEDAVQSRMASDELHIREGEVRARLEEITSLIDRLRSAVAEK